MNCKEFDSLILLSFLAGDLSEKDAAAVVRHLEHCAVCSAFVAAMEAERRKFLEEFPDVPRVPHAPVKILRFRSLPTLLSAAALLAMAAGIGSFILRQPHDIYRTKGGVDLSLFVSDSTGEATVRQDSIFYPGERIQFTYSCAKERYLILASIDENYKVTVYYPASGDSSMLVEPGSGLPLPHSIRLDGYVGYERYLAVFSGRPLSVAAVVGEIKGMAAGADALRTEPLTIRDAVVRSLVIRKKEAR